MVQYNFNILFEHEIIYYTVENLHFTVRISWFMTNNNITAIELLFYYNNN